MKKKTSNSNPNPEPQLSNPNPVPQPIYRFFGVFLVSIGLINLSFVFHDYLPVSFREASWAVVEFLFTYVCPAWMTIWALWAIYFGAKAIWKGGK